jgi:Short repeat of unknown function (DUF308)
VSVRGGRGGRRRPGADGEGESGDGVVEIAGAFRADEPAGTRAAFILSGLVSVAFAVALFARPGMGAVTLALLFGLFNLICGTSAIAQGIELRRTRKALHSVLREKDRGVSRAMAMTTARRRLRAAVVSAGPLMC